MNRDQKVRVSGNGTSGGERSGQAAQLAWSSFDKIFADGRQSGFTGSHYQQIAATLQRYLQVDTLTLEEVEERLSGRPDLATIVSALSKCQRVLYARESLSEAENNQLYSELEQLVPRSGSPAASGLSQAASSASPQPVFASPVTHDSETVPEGSPRVKRSRPRLGLFGHGLVRRVAIFVAISAVICGGAAAYAVESGMLSTGTSSPSGSVIWLTSSNVDKTLSITQDFQGNMTAAPARPVLFVECPKEACDSASLNLAAVAKHFQGKVTVVAIDPYAEPKLDATLHAQLIDPPIEQQIAVQMAVQYLQSQKKQVTSTNVQQLLSDPGFIQAVQTQLSQLTLMRPVYPKFYLMSAGTFTLAAAQVGIESETDLETFVNNGLNPPQQSAPSSPAGTGSTGATTGAGNANSTGATGSTGSAPTSPANSGQGTGGSGSSGTGK